MFPLTAAEIGMEKSPFLFSGHLLLHKFRFHPWLPQSTPSSGASSHNLFTCSILPSCEAIWTVLTCPWGHPLPSSRCLRPGEGSELCAGALTARAPCPHLRRGCRARPGRTVRLCQMPAPPRRPYAPASCSLSKYSCSVTCGYAGSAQKSSEDNGRSYIGPTSLIKPTSQTHKLAQISLGTTFKRRRIPQKASII